MICLAQAPCAGVSRSPAGGRAMAIATMPSPATAATVQSGGCIRREKRRVKLRPSAARVTGQKIA